MRISGTMLHVCGSMSHPGAKCGNLSRWQSFEPSSRYSINVKGHLAVPNTRYVHRRPVVVQTTGPQVRRSLTGVQRQIRGCKTPFNCHKRFVCCSKYLCVPAIDRAAGLSNEGCAFLAAAGTDVDVFLIDWRAVGVFGTPFIW